ncbi:MAG: sigma-54-dependent Fis family transcriptional regulator, partial [SAR86 cluster bacterium]
MNGKVLIVDDEPDIRELLEITLGRMSLQTTSAADVSSAKKILAQDNFSLCLTDMKLPDGDGIELVEHIQKYFEHIPVAVITAHGNTETAIKALKSGAFDFVSKPVDLYKLRDLVKSALRLSDSTATRAQKSPALTGPNVHPAITGKSSAIEMLREQIGKFARSQAPIFISGESGSGKELA